MYLRFSSCCYFRSIYDDCQYLQGKNHPKKKNWSACSVVDVFFVNSHSFIFISSIRSYYCFSNCLSVIIHHFQKIKQNSDSDHLTHSFCGVNSVTEKVVLVTVLSRKKLFFMLLSSSTVVGLSLKAMVSEIRARELFWNW